MTKVKKTNIATRVFDFEKSVFSKWRRETAKQKRDSIEEDCKLWKIIKFVKNEGEVSYRYI